MEKFETVSDREKEILNFWSKNKIFSKTESTKKPKSSSWYKNFLKPKSEDTDDFIFFDGPPFANGKPHYGHLLVGIIKDCIPRYKTMRGYNVARQWGWDCHGLPVEYEVEKQMNIKSKKEIVEDVGIEKFNKAARENVLKYADIWKEYVTRIGRWIDMDNAYRTMDTEYMESTWNILSRINDQGLIQKTFNVMHLCPRCETSLSNIEVAQGYKNLDDVSTYIKFQLKDSDEFFVVWTTTPWTLFGNTALAVNKEFTYVKVEHEGETLIIEESLLQTILPNASFIEKLKGEDLVGKKYTPPFSIFYEESHETGWQVYHADFVTNEDGTGIVHIAPAFGSDDFKLFEEFSLPIIRHIDLDGKFNDEVKGFEHIKVKQKGNHKFADEQVIKALERRGALLKQEPLKHQYPHCWRCDSPLLNYAMDSWIIKVPEKSNVLIRENKKVNWIPQHIKEGRFGKWLENSQNWSISRGRFWGTPIPIWESDDCKHIFVDSIEKLKKHLPSSNNKYIFARHGEAQSNVKNFLNSKLGVDNPLTNKGVKQIEFLANKLKKERIDVIITSPVERTKQTAEIIANKLGINKASIVVDYKVAEINAGEFEGKPLHEFQDAMKRSYEKGGIYNKEFMEAGESYGEVFQRVSGFLYELEKKYQGKNILVVTHGIVLEVAGLVSSGYFPRGRKFEEFQLISDKHWCEVGKSSLIDFKPLPHNERWEVDLHRPYIDKVVLRDETGREYKRIEEVLDCWVESGMMPYASNHYPFSDKNKFDPRKNKGFPADFISEGLDQTRGWFYSLLAISSLVFEKISYKNVVVTGLILASDKKKLSKSQKNYKDPLEILDKYGADAFRYVMLSSPAVRAEPFAFEEKLVSEASRKIIGRLYNCLQFYKQYEHKLSGGIQYKDLVNDTSILNKWMLSRLSETRDSITLSLDRYEIDRATKEIGVFVEDLSAWYVRRSREVVKSDTKDASYAIATLGFVLKEFSKLIAPFLPFYSEYMYQKLKTEDEAESIHMLKWPEYTRPDSDILKKMKAVKKLASAVFQVRSDNQIKTRQPLSTLKINASFDLDGNWTDILGSEVNVEKVEIVKTLNSEFELDTNITKELEEKGIAREFIRIVQSERKNAKLSPIDSVDMKVEISETTADILQKFIEEIKAKTNTNQISFVNLEGVEPIKFYNDGLKIKFIK